MASSLIYLVDDDEDDRFFAKLTFQQHFSDTELVCFEDGEELLLHIEQHPDAALPELVLVDLNMPRMNGFDTLKALKEHTDWKQVPVAILTTSSDVHDQERSKALGACAFLTKPATYEMLAQTIKSGQISCGD
ncbi:response regulator [Rudanella paleaurantiibacter]|uniref:Response regulator n=1 Tax=Rudanella paleaurantiibacter TaxID=2614655 RepID=A0A7J5U4D1_9BACT|nr:response regulator [Rudanella paleaurantiibacter]KAB7732698.1 response regulator [Rudanella paleaurantiibacter]